MSRYSRFRVRRGFVRRALETHTLSLTPTHTTDLLRADGRGRSRRSFLTTAGTAGVIAALDGRDLMAQSPSADPPPVDDRVGTEPVTLRVNGKEHRLRIDPRTTLLDCLRETMALTGTKKGCDHGQCGACTVHVNGRRVNSCLSLALMHDGEEITTIDGLGSADSLHPMQPRS